MLKSPSSTWLAKASKIAAKTKEKVSWVSSERGSSSSWFSDEVGKNFTFCLDYGS
jgi:hypothetical protein